MYILGFSHWEDGGGRAPPPPPAKNLLIPANLEKFPPSRLHPSLSPNFHFPPPPPLSNNFQVINQ